MVKKFLSTLQNRNKNLLNTLRCFRVSWLEEMKANYQFMNCRFKLNELLIIFNLFIF
jgi:hypothetical protein